jgi:hypothetical protein
VNLLDPHAGRQVEEGDAERRSSLVPTGSGANKPTGELAVSLLYAATPSPHVNAMTPIGRERRTQEAQFAGKKDSFRGVRNLRTIQPRGCLVTLQPLTAYAVASICSRRGAHGRTARVQLKPSPRAEVCPAALSWQLHASVFVQLRSVFTDVGTYQKERFATRLATQVPYDGDSCASSCRQMVVSAR